MNQFCIYFLLFTAYSFLGWLCESICCSAAAGKFINRGFLNGPFCPIYGFGGLLVVTVLSPFRDRLFLLYVIAVALTSGLEYLTGFALETLFHAKYWDYSDHRFNLQGRVCLENSLIFGLLSVAAVLYLQPALLALIALMPAKVLPFLAGGLLFYFALDTSLTVNAIFSLNGKLAELQQMLDEMKERAHITTSETFEALQATISERLDDTAKARLKSLFESKNRFESSFHMIQRRIIRAFPTMKSLRNNESLQRVREVIQSRAKSIRRK